MTYTLSLLRHNVSPSPPPARVAVYCNPEVQKAERELQALLAKQRRVAQQQLSRLSSVGAAGGEQSQQQSQLLGGVAAAEEGEWGRDGLGVVGGGEEGEGDLFQLAIAFMHDRWACAVCFGVRCMCVYM